jgi:extradiol dioxygenase family protein
MPQPFHLAIPVSNLETMRRFYGEVLGCAEGRSSDHWVDLDFFGHQLVLHQKVGFETTRSSNPVDGHDVPVPHFGVVLEREVWNALATRLKTSGQRFIIEPYIRFEGQVGEQATMFFEDPEGNALEFKSFGDLGQLFAK